MVGLLAGISRIRVKSDFLIFVSRLLFMAHESRYRRAEILQFASLRRRLLVAKRRRRNGGFGFAQIIYYLMIFCLVYQRILY